jgi:hypothetical protein
LPKITKSFVEKEIKSEGCFRDTELKGFCVRARKVSDGSLSKTYIVHSKVRGTSKLVTVTIGRHGVITAENARIEAIKILSDMARGENPNVTLQDKQEDLRKEDARRKTMSELSARTLSDLLQEYLATRSLKENTATDYERLVTRCLKDWLDVPIVEITRDMVQSKHIAMSKEHPAQANYTMRILRALFAYAIAVYEDDQGKPLLTQNPVDRLRQAAFNADSVSSARRNYKAGTRPSARSVPTRETCSCWSCSLACVKTKPCRFSGRTLTSNMTPY